MNLQEDFYFGPSFWRSSPFHLLLLASDDLTKKLKTLEFIISDDIVKKSCKQLKQATIKEVNAEFSLDNGIFFLIIYTKTARHKFYEKKTNCIAKSSNNLYPRCLFFI